MSNIFTYYKGFVLSNTQISQSSIKISSGEVVPNDITWNLNFGYKNTLDKFVAIEANNSLYGRIDTVIGKPNICTINGNYASIDFIALKGTSGLNPIINTDIGSPSIFLGYVYVPAQFPNRPSLLCTRSINQLIVETIIAQYPIVTIQNILSSIEEWQPNTVYLHGQLVKSNNSIFISLLSHGSSNTLDYDITNNYWQSITGDQQDLQEIITSVLTHLLPEYIKHPGQPNFSLQFNIDNQFQGSEKLKWNTQFNQLELNGGLMLKNQFAQMQTPTDGINMYCKSSGISPTKHVECFIDDELGMQHTVFTTTV